MKKIVTILCLSLIFLLGLTGCMDNSKLDPDKPVTLSVWHIYGEQTDSPMNDLIDEFNSTVGEEKGIVLKVTNMTTTPDIKDQLDSAFEGAPGAPEMPDLFSARPDTILDIREENLVDFQDYFTPDDLEEYVPEFVKDGMFDDHLFVFPVSRSTRALFINASQFERFSKATGVTYQDLNTWEGFFDASEKYYKWSDGQAFCAIDYPIQSIEYDMIARGNVPEYTADGWYDISDKALKKSFMRFAKPLAKGHIVVSDKYANTQIMTGEVLAGVGSSASINYYNDEIIYPNNTKEPMNLKVLPLPKSGTGMQYMPVTGTGFAAYKTTDQKAEAAAVFLRWLTQGKRNLDFVVEAGYMPVHNSAFDAIEDYDFPSPAHEALFDAIKTMKKEYKPLIRPEVKGYYDKVEILYEGLKERCPDLKKRADAGEDPKDLAEELWDFFCSLQ